MKAVIVADGAHAPADRRRLADADLVIAADGGADWLAAVGVPPHHVVGDLDSVNPDTVRRLADTGVPVEQHPIDKDASDLELSLAAAAAAGADEVVVLGGLGGDLDHLAANLLLLGSELAAGRATSLVHDRTTARMLIGPAHLELGAPAGSRVSLLAVGGPADGVTTRGLRWSLDDAQLIPGSSRGLANVVLDAPAAITITAGQILVVEIDAGAQEVES
ncbi:MAG TPA: thiamine diphosphokinase [Candidatus Limnocylindria bacterium]|nr:thiamine diphosphokinase [Candidatus Limnocylindria bacterium]